MERRTHLQPNYAVLAAARKSTQRSKKADKAKTRRSKGHAVYAATVGVRVRAHEVNSVRNSSRVPMVAGSAPFRNKVRFHEQEMLGQNLTDAALVRDEYTCNSCLLRHAPLANFPLLGGQRFVFGRDGL